MLVVPRPTATDPPSERRELDDATRVRAIAGDDAAARALVELYQARVFALLSRLLAGRGRATVEDLAQDTFLAVFRGLGGFDPRGPARLSTWILTIAARRAIDELRKARPALLPDPGRTRASEDRADARSRRRELAQAIERALAALSPELRAAFVLREYHDLDYVEIARALDIELGTVRSRLSRARGELRARLAEVRDD